MDGENDQYDRRLKKVYAWIHEFSSEDSNDLSNSYLIFKEERRSIISKNLNRKGNENPVTYRNVSSFLNLSPQDKSKRILHKIEKREMKIIKRDIKNK